MLKICLLGLGMSIFSSVFAQKMKLNPTKTKRATEVGLNITSTLAGFFNSGGDQIPLDPYIVSLKFAHPKNALRVGFNIRTSQKDEQISGLEGTRNVVGNRFSLRFGNERRIVVHPKFSLYYGLDAIGLFENSKVDFTSSLGLATLKNFKIGGGGGPIMGITWAPIPRIIFGTEATLYAIFYQKNEKREIPLEPQMTAKSVGFDLASIPPTSLYIHFKF